VTAAAPRRRRLGVVVFVVAVVGGGGAVGCCPTPTARDETEERDDPAGLNGHTLPRVRGR